MGMSILDDIITRKKETVAELKRSAPYSSLERSARPVKPFLVKGGKRLIAECKKASPSKGIISGDYDPVRIAKSYAAGGADAVSVLTEEHFFLGSARDFRNVRSAIDIPMIRKDFMIDPYQIRESWAIGADAVLLISAALSDEQMRELYEAAKEYGLGVLAEAHDETEIERCLVLEDAYVGINSRNLKNFAVDLPRIAAMRRMIPENRIAVAESGIDSFENAGFIVKEGFDAFLVGEFFMRAENPEERVREFKRMTDK
jgi:indole-3-glycerol phosphate synthase